MRAFPANSAWVTAETSLLRGGVFCILPMQPCMQDAVLWRFSCTEYKSKSHYQTTFGCGLGILLRIFITRWESGEVLRGTVVLLHVRPRCLLNACAPKAFGRDMAVKGHVIRVSQSRRWRRAENRWDALKFSQWLYDDDDDNDTVAFPLHRVVAKQKRNFAS